VGSPSVLLERAEQRKKLNPSAMPCKSFFSEKIKIGRHATRHAAQTSGPARHTAKMRAK